MPCREFHVWQHGGYQMLVGEVQETALLGGCRGIHIVVLLEMIRNAVPHLLLADERYGNPCRIKDVIAYKREIAPIGIAHFTGPGTTIESGR